MFTFVCLILKMQYQGGNDCLQLFMKCKTVIHQFAFNNTHKISEFLLKSNTLFR